MATSNAAHTRAEAHFKVRADQKADAPKAMQDYRAAQQAAIDRIPRLRELRLAREAALARAK